MKIQGKQNIEYWITQSKTGAMIRVYRIDPLGDLSNKKNQNPFNVPILVDYMSQGEGIATILEERDELRKNKEYLEEQVRTARSELFDYQYRNPKTLFARIRAVFGK